MCLCVEIAIQGSLPHSSQLATARPSEFQTASVLCIEYCNYGQYTLYTDRNVIRANFSVAEMSRFTWQAKHIQNTLAIDRLFLERADREISKGPGFPATFEGGKTGKVEIS